MKDHLRVFLLEDLRTDQELIKRQILKAAPGAVFTIASNRKEFEEKIQWGVPDIILSDYQLPDYNGLKALLYVKEKMAHIPFIFVTGQLNNEERVADTILQGAAGYILKENLRDLPQKIREVVATSEAKQAAEQEQRNRQRKLQLMLQKLETLLGEAPEFEQKEALQKTVSELRNVN